MALQVDPWWSTFSGLANASRHSLFEGMHVAGEEGLLLDNEECQQTDEHLGDSLAILVVRLE